MERVEAYARPLFRHIISAAGELTVLGTDEPHRPRRRFLASVAWAAG
jgi:hypothetical protein